MDNSVLHFVAEPLNTVCRVAMQRIDRVQPTVRACSTGKTNLVDAAIIMSEVVHDLEQLFSRWNQVGTQQRSSVMMMTISFDQEAWRLRRDSHIAPGLIRTHQLLSNGLLFFASKLSEQHKQIWRSAQQWPIDICPRSLNNIFIVYISLV